MANLLTRSLRPEASLLGKPPPRRHTRWSTRSLLSSRPETRGAVEAASAWRLPQPPPEGQTEPQPGQPSRAYRGDCGGPRHAKQDVRHDGDHAGHGQPQERGADDGQSVADPQKPLLSPCLNSSRWYAEGAMSSPVAAVAHRNAPKYTSLWIWLVWPNAPGERQDQHESEASGRREGEPGARSGARSAPG